MAYQWLGLKHAIPCHYDDPALPEIVRFREVLAEARQADPLRQSRLSLAQARP